MKKIRFKFLIFLGILGLIWVVYFPILKAYSQSKNEVQLAEIKQTNPTVFPVFKAFVAEVEATTDWQVLIISGYRDEEEQAVLKKMNPKNASAGKSKHNFGKAIDICVFRRRGFFSQWLIKSSSKKAWEMSQIPDIAKRFKLNWGGNFSNYHDPVHFEIN